MCFFFVYRYAYNYILALTETVKILDELSEDPEAATTTSDFPMSYNPAHPVYSTTTTTNIDKPPRELKTEPVWHYETNSCPQYSPKQSVCSGDSYDYYSDVSCSPQSNDWSSANSEIEESPVKYTAHNLYHYAPQTINVPAISAALSHCH